MNKSEIVNPPPTEVDAEPEDRDDDEQDDAPKAGPYAANVRHKDDILAEIDGKVPYARRREADFLVERARVEMAIDTRDAIYDLVDALERHTAAAESRQ
jgi:hypothetical protein